MTPPVTAALTGSRWLPPSARDNTATSWRRRRRRLAGTRSTPRTRRRSLNKTAQSLIIQTTAALLPGMDHDSLNTVVVCYLCFI